MLFAPTSHHHWSVVQRVVWTNGYNTFKVKVCRVVSSLFCFVMPSLKTATDTFLSSYQTKWFNLKSDLVLRIQNWKCPTWVVASGHSGGRDGEARDTCYNLILLRPFGRVSWVTVTILREKFIPWLMSHLCTAAQLHSCTAAATTTSEGEFPALARPWLHMLATWWSRGFCSRDMKLYLMETSAVIIDIFPIVDNL